MRRVVFSRFSALVLTLVVGTLPAAVAGADDSSDALMLWLTNSYHTRNMAAP